MQYCDKIAYAQGAAGAAAGYERINPAAQISQVFIGLLVTMVNHQQLLRICCVHAVPLYKIH